VRHIVALRGDPPPEAGGRFTPHPQGYAGAAELVAGLKELHPFEISVAAYPEVHPEAASAEADLDNLKRKLDAGASRAITQFFFSSDAYFRFLDKALAAGITAPILPGIMPVTSFAAIRRMSANTEIPAWMEAMFDTLDSRPGPRALVAATVAAEFCRSLYDGGVRDFHFYTLNRAEQAYAVCHLLGLRASK
jgi:methylenetetrahydrofolate reductase (NADPH)